MAFIRHHQQVDPPGFIGFSVRVGARAPMLDSCSGLTLLAFRPSWENDEAIFVDDEVELMGQKVVARRFVEADVGMSFPKRPLHDQLFAREWPEKYPFPPEAFRRQDEQEGGGLNLTLTRVRTRTRTRTSAGRAA